MPGLVTEQRKGRGPHGVECPGRHEGRWKATTPRPEVCPGSAWRGVWGARTALELRLVQSRGQRVGLATEDSGWVWRSVRAALWAVGGPEVGPQGDTNPSLGLSLLLGPQSQRTFLILSQGCEPDD